MNVRIRLFAVLRERAGADAIELELADDATVADALRVLQESGPLAGLVARLPVQMAVNREYATHQTPLAPDDELALIPPVSGGDDDATSGSDERARIHVLVTDAPLSIDALAVRATRPGAGALVIFTGVTRDVEALHYEAYREMAEETIAGIARECVERHGLEAVAIEHRVGDVMLGQPSVVVAVSAAHRDEAFAGAREAIDRIKAQAPIWKRELGSEQPSRWVKGTPPQQTPLSGGRMLGTESSAREAAR